MNNLKIGAMFTLKDGSKKIVMEKKNLRVIEISSECIKLEDHARLYSDHRQDCCENHYLSFDDLTIEDFDGLEFDFSNDNFFERVENYGIRLIATNGVSIGIPGYGYNNGYYGTELTLCVSGRDFDKSYDITDCQKISG